MSKIHQVVIAGAGGMGSATGLLLRELGDFEVDVLIGDAEAEKAQAAAAWIREGSTKPGEVIAFSCPSTARARGSKRSWSAETSCSTACRARRRRGWRGSPAHSTSTTPT